MLPWTPFSDKKGIRTKRGGSVDTNNLSENGLFHRDKRGSFGNLWRPSSLVNLVNPIRRQTSAVFDSSPTDSTNSNETPKQEDNAIVTSNTDNLKVDHNNKEEASIKKKSEGWGTMVSIILVEAKGLPSSPTDGSSHGLYCKIRLGSQTIKSKTVQSSHRPEWRERFQFYILKDNVMKISLWDKGKQKTFMGSCALQLSTFERERTHEIWQQLDNGYGALRLSITICNIRNANVDNTQDVQALNNQLRVVLVIRFFLKIERPLKIERLGYMRSRFFKVTINHAADWNRVGELHVKVISAKGLTGRYSTHCTLEVDNERVRTHSARGAEPKWNKTFVFNVYDVTSTLDLKVHESSLMTALNNESLGRVSIPLLRIRNGETKWYALKDKSKRNIARPSCPRVLLEMSFFYNPIKASLRMFQPKEVKYIKKEPKFDISLVYKNMEFIRDALIFICAINESYKRLFEWDNQELSFIALSCWLMFWYNFRLWTAPLLLLLPFFYFWICNRNHLEKSFLRGYGLVDDPDKDKAKAERSLTGRLQELPEMTIVITNGIDFLASLAEKLYNLASFKVPFLSYLIMLLLIVSSAGLYLIPFNCIMMLLGIYKFTRKYFKPERTLNNDLEDFLSRIPDTDILNDWKELSVPEPTPMNGINVAKHPFTFKDSVMY